MTLKREVGEKTVQAIARAAQAIESFAVEVEPGADSGFEPNSLEQVVMAIDQLLRSIAGIQMALYYAAQHAARRE